MTLQKNNVNMNAVINKVPVVSKGKFLHSAMIENVSLSNERAQRDVPQIAVGHVCCCAM